MCLIPRHWSCMLLTFVLHAMCESLAVRLPLSGLGVVFAETHFIHVCVCSQQQHDKMNLHGKQQALCTSSTSSTHFHSETLQQVFLQLESPRFHVCSVFSVVS